MEALQRAIDDVGNRTFVTGCGCATLGVAAVFLAIYLLGNGLPAGQGPGTTATPGPTQSGGTPAPSATPAVTPIATMSALAPMACEPGTSDIAIDDHDMADWQLQIYSTAPVAVGTASDGGGFRSVHIEFGGKGVLDLRHTWNGGTYDPVRCGPITSFDMAFRGAMLDRSVESARLPVWLLLHQGENIYWALPVTQVSGDLGAWQAYAIAGLGTQWGYSGPGPAQPNLTNGSPIAFGFWNAASGGGETVTLTAGVDDWHLVIHRR